MPRNENRTPGSGSQRITTIDVVRTDPNQRSVKVNGRVVARLTMADIQRLGLQVGAAWSKSLAATVEATLQESRARGAALAMLARKPKSSSDVAAKLQSRGFPAELVVRIVKQLKRDRWLDDEQFARQVVTSALRRGPVARPALFERLGRRGIEGPAAERAIYHSLAEAEELPDPVAYARRLATRNPRGGERAIARRVAGALARRGFDAETIESSLREAGLRTEIN